MMVRKTVLGFLALVVVFVAPVGVHGLQRGVPQGHWSSASRAPVGLAPSAEEEPGAVIQVYAAPTYGWRGIFAVHPWIAVRRAGSSDWDRYEVVGWGGGRVTRDRMAPDARWYGAEPRLLLDLRGGAEVDALIARVEAAVASYPYTGSYRTFPGPNSNTFLAHIGRSVPELGLDMPANAIGKNWLPWDEPVSTAPSGGGFMLSFEGLGGLLVAPEEGVELTFLGLSLGVDFDPLDVRLPGFGGVR
ncbi:hypothetical protein C882_2865 [Caenispirillum salinarum AK4]|uniref:DUF3750 domain-containing protein n=2 Tax=Caenispirillum TaxID=414051 RepID=K9GMG9_9PROT|nr:hypothetical protein C882_2865 [Caenispirillum salinarum AK4]